MSRRIIVLMSLCGIALMLGPAWAMPRIAVTHRLSNVVVDNNSATCTYTYTIRVQNNGSDTLLNMALELVPLRSGLPAGTRLSFGDIAPGTYAEEFFTFVWQGEDGRMLDDSAFRWAGSCCLALGGVVTFPAVSSDPGGAI